MASRALPKLRYLYFEKAVNWHGEPPRVVLTIAGVPFEDVRLVRAEWTKNVYLDYYLICFCIFDETQAEGVEVNGIFRS